MISVTKLNKSFNKKPILRDLSFNIEKGSLIGFIGPNGSGKTTTLRCLTTLITPDSGQIILNGIDIIKKPYYAREVIGYAPEGTPLIEELTILQFLKYRYNLKKNNKEKISTTPLQVIEQCDLKEQTNTPIEKLSQGYRKRVGIADALLASPQILLLDEPTNGLDPNQIIKIRDLLLKLKENHTLIVSSHVLSELEIICDRFLMISEGKIKIFDTKENMLKRQNQETKIHIHLTAINEQFIEKIKELSFVLNVNSTTNKVNQNIEIIIKTSHVNSEIKNSLWNYIRSQENTLTHFSVEKPSLESIYLEKVR